MATGTVILIDEARSRFLLRLHQASIFSVFSLRSDVGIAIGDEVRGNLSAMGPQKIRHVRQELTIRVFGETGPCTEEQGVRRMAT